ncbi:unnamed protein product [Arctogadus glacialis]
MEGFPELGEGPLAQSSLVWQHPGASWGLTSQCCAAGPQSRPPPPCRGREHKGAPSTPESNEFSKRLRNLELRATAPQSVHLIPTASYLIPPRASSSCISTSLHLGETAVRSEEVDP